MPGLDAADLTGEFRVQRNRKAANAYRHIDHMDIAHFQGTANIALELIVQSKVAGNIDVDAVSSAIDTKRCFDILCSCIELECNAVAQIQVMIVNRLDFGCTQSAGRSLCHSIGLELLIQLLHIVGHLAAIQCFRLGQVSFKDPLCVNALKNIRIFGSGGGHDRHISLRGHSSGYIGNGNTVRIYDKSAPAGHGFRTICNPDNAILYLHLSPIRYFNYIGLEDIGAVVVFGYDSTLKNLLRVRHHGRCFGRGHSLLRQEFPAHQYKPATVHRHLNVIFISDVRCVGIGICTAIQLEAKAVVQRVRRELTGSRLVRLKGQTGLQIDYAKLHRHH